MHLGSGYPVEIGDHVTIGHGAIIHGCKIGDNTMIGMGAILMNGCTIGKNCIIGAGALVPEGMVIPDGSVAVGVPARVIKTISAEQAAHNVENAQHYVTDAKNHDAVIKVSQEFTRM